MLKRRHKGKAREHETGLRAGRWRGYAVAVAGTAVAALVRWALGRAVGAIPPYITFYPAVLAAAVAGGTGAGILATILSAVAVDLLFIEPVGKLGPVTPADAVGLGLFIAINLAISIVGGRLRAAQHRTRRQAGARLAAIVENSEDAILSEGLDGAVTSWNPAAERLYGYRAEEIIGHPVTDIIPPERQAEHRAIMERLLRGERIVPYESVRVTRAGRRLDVVVTLSPLRDLAGRIVGASKIVRDITERKQAAGRQAALLGELAAVNRELNDFATIVSHDLKAPLRGVATLAKWVQSDYADKLDEEGRENLAEMVKRVGRMDRMIEDILAYSRLGRTEAKPESVALAELVAGVVRDLAPPAQVQIHIAPGLPVLCGEPVRLRQLFQNLIGNAIKYADKPQVEIHVGWADVGSFWEFRVSDNGPGIEARHFERIFKIFQTLAPKDKTDSTGVGLALVKRIVEQAGGRVWVESQMGNGSIFYFTWPKAEARREELAVPPASLPDREALCDARL